MTTTTTKTQQPTSWSDAFLAWGVGDFYDDDDDNDDNDEDNDDADNHNNGDNNKNDNDGLAF